jgi:hypothetical protein
MSIFTDVNICIHAREHVYLHFGRGDHFHTGEYRQKLNKSLVTLTEDGRLTWLGVSSCLTKLICGGIL